MACIGHPEISTGNEHCERCGAEVCPDCYVVLADRAYCAACKLEYVRDRRSGIVPGALDLASVGARFVGIWVDGFITAVASYAIVIPVAIGLAALGAASEAASGDPGVVPMLLTLITYPALLGVPVIYEGLMLARRGQTLGKMALGVKVVTPEGGEIGRGQAWGRAALKLVFGTCMGIDYLPAFFTRERTCLHDMIARTRVVKVRG
jgi:uncharacterized RDD family membrane protein YckC